MYGKLSPEINFNVLLRQKVTGTEFYYETFMQNNAVVE